MTTTKTAGMTAGMTRIGDEAFGLGFQRWSTEGSRERVKWTLLVGRSACDGNEPTIEVPLTHAVLRDMKSFIQDAEQALATDGGRALAECQPDINV
ncbi:MAG: hypothetical protein AAFX52_11035 [Pseudomonadota bacterium]